VNGHDYEALLRVLTQKPTEAGKPTCIIAETIKGRGISFMENDPKWHHGIPNAEQLQRAREELMGGAR
jgi:transketolase